MIILAKNYKFLAYEQEQLKVSRFRINMWSIHLEYDNVPAI